MEQIGFAVACKKYFGLLPGQKVGEFVREIKDLTDDDRREMAPLLSAELGAFVMPER